MFIIIPTGYSAHSTVYASARAECTCEKCHTRFECKLLFKGYGTGSSSLMAGGGAASDAAELRAREALQNPRNISSAIPQPCPSCGWYQGAMVRYHKGTIMPGLFLFLLSLGLIAVLVTCIFSFYLISEDGAKAIVDIVTSPVLWIGLAIPAVLLSLILLARHLSDLNRPHPLFKRVKDPTA